MRLGFGFRRSRDKELSPKEKLEIINNLETALTQIRESEMKTKSKLELQLREADRRRRALERKAKLCNNELDRELYNKEKEGYVRLEGELRERISAIHTRIAKIESIKVKLQLIKTDIVAGLRSRLYEVIEKFLEAFNSGEPENLERNLDYQLSRLEEELERLLINLKEREYSSWLDLDIDKRKDKEKEVDLT